MDRGGGEGAAAAGGGGGGVDAPDVGEDIIQQLYLQQQCLWNKQLEEFHREDAREAAYRALCQASGGTMHAVRRQVAAAHRRLEADPPPAYSVFNQKLVRECRMGEAAFVRCLSHSYRAARAGAGAGAAWGAVGRLLRRDPRALARYWRRLERLAARRLAVAVRVGDEDGGGCGAGNRARGEGHALHTLLLYHPGVRLVTEEVMDNYTSLRPLKHLYHLVRTLRAEAWPQPPPRRAWAALLRVHRQRYNSGSAVLLQRRWHQLKEAARDAMLACWGDCDAPPPNALLVDIVNSYPHVVTQPQPAWEQLVAAGDVFCDEDLDIDVDVIQLLKDVECTSAGAGARVGRAGNAGGAGEDIYGLLHQLDLSSHLVTTSIELDSDSDREEARPDPPSPRACGPGDVGRETEDELSMRPVANAAPVEDGSKSVGLQKQVQSAGGAGAGDATAAAPADPVPATSEQTTLSADQLRELLIRLEELKKNMATWCCVARQHAYMCSVRDGLRRDRRQRWPSHMKRHGSNACQCCCMHLLEDRLRFPRCNVAEEVASLEQELGALVRTAPGSPTAPTAAPFATDDDYGHADLEGLIESITEPPPPPPPPPAVVKSKKRGRKSADGGPAKRRAAVKAKVGGEGGGAGDGGAAEAGCDSDYREWIRQRTLVERAYGLRPPPPTPPAPPPPAPHVAEMTLWEEVGAGAGGGAGAGAGEETGVDVLTAVTSVRRARYLLHSGRRLFVHTTAVTYPSGGKLLRL